MQKYIFILSAAIMPFLAKAQTSGEIIFKESRKLDIKLPDDLPEEMKAKIPTTSDANKILRFTKEQSLYNNLSKENDTSLEHSSEDGDNQMKIVIKQPEDVMYKNLKDNKLVDKRELMGKDFLIKDDLKSYAWKLSTETKNILNYPCTKATTIAGKDTITAWFTMKIPVSNGPNSLGKLPGMVLEATYNGGKRSMLATKIDLKDVDETLIVAPTKGKEITAEKYEELAEEKRREMREGGGMMIRREVRY